LSIDGEAVRITKARARQDHGGELVRRLRGRGVAMSTYEIMALTRGE
jgi:hypothetical protein